MKTHTRHDKLGRELTVDDCVAYDSYHGGLTIGRVVKLNRVRVRIQRLTDTKLTVGPEDIWERDIVKLDSKDVTFYLLKESK